MIFEANDLIKKLNGDDDFTYPCYEENCISNIPGSILDLFGLKGRLPQLPSELTSGIGEIDKIILLILDDFGHNQFLRYYRSNTFLNTLAEKSKVFPLTSTFPSQTTNALTTLTTGLTPQQHGLFEYYLYLKEVDSIINTLRFKPLGSRKRDELLEKGYNPNILFRGKTIQNTLETAGVKSFTHISASYAYTPYSQLLFSDSTFVTTMKSSDLIVGLRKKLEKTKGPAYFFVHLSDLDAIAHEYGPKSYEYGAELAAISYLLNRELVQKIDANTAKQTLLLMTSDHGGVQITPKDTTYLNGFNDVLGNLKHDKKGKTILPTGSARDVFLHVKEEKLAETQKSLAEKVGDKAKIIETKDALKKGLFGHGEIIREFIDRAGNLLILPYGNETVFFEHFPDMPYNPVGQHGGLNEEEMIVPLAVTKLYDLK